MMAEKPEPSNYHAWQRQQFYEDSLMWANDPCMDGVRRIKNATEAIMTFTLMA